MADKGEHREGCGCPACAGLVAHKRKLFMAMVFFGLMAICNAIIVGVIHLVLHAIEARE